MMKQSTEQKTQHLPAPPAQKTIAVVISACWIAYLIYLLTLPASPQLGEWAGPPHLSSSVILAIALSTVLSRYISNNPLLGWWTIVTSTILITSFECLQLLTPSRTFQFKDIAEGVAGAAIAAMVAVMIIRIIGRSAYVWLALGVAVIALIASLLLLRPDAPDSEVSCTPPVSANLDWDLVLINTFAASQQHENLVSTNIGPLCLFDNNTDEQLLRSIKEITRPSSENHSLQLRGEGLLSAELTGLRQALSTSGEITFGIRFKADALQAGRPPAFIASLQSKDDPQAMAARLFQNGSSATASFSFHPWQGSSTVMANRLQGRYHEVVLTYDGSVQTTYFDGLPVGTETTKIDPPDASDAELILSLGKRVDRRWKPFTGEISAVVIGAKSLNADSVATVFTQ